MVAGDVTALIEAAGKGDEAALQALLARVYDELKQLAAASGNTLNTTALVHEAYLKLAQPDSHHLYGRTHPANDLRVLEVKVALVNALAAHYKTDAARTLRAEIESLLKPLSSPYAADLRERLAAK